MDPKPFFESWQFWWQVVMLVGIIANGIYSWWTNREKITGRRFQALEKDVSRRVTDQALRELTTQREALCARHQDRTVALELSVATISADMRAMPGHSNINKLHGRVDAVQKELSTMNGELKGIARTVDLIQQHLMKVGE